MGRHSTLSAAGPDAGYRNTSGSGRQGKVWYAAFQQGLGKRLQFLQETIPALSHVALLVKDTQVARLYAEVTDAVATKLGLTNHTFSARETSWSRRLMRW
jgi:hypothetical protein